MTVRLLQGHVLDVLRALPPGSAQMCVTSPPYWGLRDYGLEPQLWDDPGGCCHQWVDTSYRDSRKNDETAGLKQRTSTGSLGWRNEVRSCATCERCPAWRGSLGLEPTPELYVSHLVQVFREVRRVLRDDSTLWINLGDSYASGGRDGHGTRVGYKQQTNRGMNGSHDPARPPQPHGLKPKDLIGVPWLVAFALQADGWWLRSDIIWHKPNPMPESVTDRPTKSHEYLFLLSKNERYYYDAEAITEKSVGSWNSAKSTLAANGVKNVILNQTGQRRTAGANTFHRDEDRIGRNKRSVWTIPTASYAEAHFATFPPALVEPCIKAGTSEKGCCQTCLSPWVRVIDRYRTHNGERDDTLGAWRNTDRGSPIGAQGDGHWRYASESHTLGWKPSCACRPAGEPIPCTVLDPFGGSGTSALVADRLGRDAVLIDLNPAYVEMQRKRLVSDAPLFVELED